MPLWPRPDNFLTSRVQFRSYLAWDRSHLCLSLHESLAHLFSRFLSLSHSHSLSFLFLFLLNISEWWIGVPLCQTRPKIYHSLTAESECNSSILFVKEGCKIDSEDGMVSAANFLSRWQPSEQWWKIFAKILHSGNKNSPICRIFFFAIIILLSCFGYKVRKL